MENWIILNRGKVNHGADVMEVWGRHQGSTKPRAPGSGSTENSSSFLMRAPPIKRCQLVRMSGRMGQGVWRMMCLLSFAHNDMFWKLFLKQTLSVFNDAWDPLFFFGQGDRRKGWNVWCPLITAHGEEASKTTGQARHILSMGYLNIYIFKEESSLVPPHTRDFLASLNSKGF